MQQAARRSGCTHWVGGGCKQFTETQPLQVVCRVERVETRRERRVTLVKNTFSQRCETLQRRRRRHIRTTIRAASSAVATALGQYLPQQQPHFPHTLRQPRSFHRGISRHHLGTISFNSQTHNASAVSVL